MKKIVLFAVVLTMACTYAQATLTTIGEKGMLHTIIAGNEGQGMVGIGGYGIYWQSEFDLETMTSNYKKGIGNYFVSYVPLYSLEAFISQAAGAYQIESPKERNVDMGDTYMGAKFSRELNSMISWGIHSSFRMPTGAGDYGIETTAFENNLLLSADLTNYDIAPLNIHFNFGYVKTGEDEPEVNEASDALIINSAVVLPSHIFSPFIEYSTYQAKEMGDRAFSENPILLTPGLALYFPYGLSLQFGVDIPISKVKPFERRAVASASWVIALKELLKPMGARTLIGQVLDNETGLPVEGANVKVINAVVPNRKTEEKTGTFEYTNLPADFTTLMIEKDGYKKFVKVVHIEKGQEKSLQFRINPEKEGKVSGKVIDKFSSKPVVASITISGDEEEKKTELDGSFSLNVEEGISEVTFKNENYESFRDRVTVRRGEEKFLLVKMRPLKKKDILIGTIHFESNKAVINTQAEEIFSKAVQYLRDNPGVKIEVGGHTDNTGGEQMNLDLSRVRAESVREHILSQYGVSPDKVIAKGYGEWVTVGDNDTKEGRRKNRRVEIKIIWAD
jgi:outer membrane protein OmpA-like peptidoglycan-associated protein